MFSSHLPLHEVLTKGDGSFYAEERCFIFSLVCMAQDLNRISSRAVIFCPAAAYNA